MDWASTGCISDFFFSLRIACLGITSNRKLPPFHIEAETFSISKTTCNSYDKNMGTASAMVATVNMPWRKMYISMRFWSPNNPLKRHHMLFAFWAFFESSLWTIQLNNERGKGKLFSLPIHMTLKHLKLGTLFFWSSRDREVHLYSLVTCRKSSLPDLLKTFAYARHWQWGNIESATMCKLPRVPETAMSRETIYLQCKAM